jgi:peptidoglycan hydrolase-like protein with peptidoglycan-binding domain
MQWSARNRASVVTAIGLVKRNDACIPVPSQDRRTTATRSRPTSGTPVAMSLRRCFVALVALMVAGAGCSLPEAADSAPAVDAPSVVRPGDQGDHVARLQRDLRVLGVDVDIDGEYDPAMEREVESLQSFFDLGVDGIVGPRTRALLDGLLEKTATTHLDVVPAGTTSTVDDTGDDADGATGATPATGVEATVHDTGDAWCVEILAGESGASACFPHGEAPLSVRYAAFDGWDQLVLVGVVRAPAAAVTAIDADGVEHELAMTTLFSDDGPGAEAFVVAEPTARAVLLRAVDATGDEVAVQPLVNDEDSDLALGDVGPAVVAWQQRFAGTGADVAIDGVYSFDLAGVVSAAQSYLQLEPNGRLDAATRRAFEPALAEPSN